MKITFLSFYSGEVARGVETFVHEVANRLAGSGHDVVVFQGGRRVEGSRYETKTIKADNVFGFSLKVFRELNGEIEILFPTNGRFQSFFSRLWTLFRKTKLVISGQAGPGLDDGINLWTFPDIFLGLTNEQVRWARKVNPFVRVSKIPNGVDLSKFKKGAGVYKHGLSGKVVLYVAALEKIKRPEIVIKTVSRLENVSLLLVGKGTMEEELKRMAEETIPGRFKIVSFPHDEMPSVYSSADLFVFPTSPWESFGIVMVEAMAAGLPVVANGDPIRREIVGKAGLFVDPTDTEKFAETIKRALKKDWGDIPRKQAKKFDWDKIAKKYEDLFEELLWK